eukprot:m51a1_g5478 hypothetical protein (154) ;mRNA; f:296793-297391
MSAGVQVRVASAAERKTVHEALLRLAPMLGWGVPPPRPEDVDALLSCPSSALMLAYSSAGEVVGMTTVVTVSFLRGKRAIIEDVAVDPQHRGRGVGECLIAAALAQAKHMGAAHCDLTCRPERESANRLYARSGFVRSPTDMFRRACQQPHNA